MAAPGHRAAGLTRRRTSPACNPAHSPCTPCAPTMQLRVSILRPREPRSPACPCLQRLLVLDINIKMRGADDAYFEQLGVGPRVPRVGIAPRDSA